MAFEQILLIEDDHEIFISAAKGVSASVSCTTLFDAKEALKKLAKKEIIPDVIFLDLNMPVMSGQQFLMEIKRNTELKNIPVIIFSTTSHSGTIQVTKELGAHDFIIKPGRFDEWVSLLKPLLK
ncbi:MAG: response regulator [Cyclobacteriaceae bacterium]